MDLDEYQEKASKTDLGTIAKENNFDYYALGLVNEAGEVAGKIKKLHRDFDGKMTDDYRKEIAKEMGDVLWYLSALCDKFDLNLAEIAQANIDKLYSRKERGLIKGNGDNR
ncbi:MAG: nucleoside triphosphate pyrophosphohydrolase family protein [Candidatus Diapherotrites archaeon]|jgi:NTP pyrophosphatase (non-canonical NTP hydrolase)|uniref:Nucleoside triphosphate pyrophosphohydrolase family protein n=1 Tax=Candidatus Iainarchaeum sp. TaxID=3101447 RepID=A0A8T5GFM5_9ARCH|nr:nucleoside triphosphate pyrophosphohydrolase family protein [Candidatus Diapherotrites archaeon]MBT7241187.1 nucleoside triphosphate pyrophosphohydrolase family protein [Candidatus Diapherotrites archaeon]